MDDRVVLYDTNDEESIICGSHIFVRDKKTVRVEKGGISIRLRSWGNCILF